MRTTISGSISDRVLVIHTAERLDFSQHEPFCRACEESLSLGIQRIDIDMGATIQIYDSGIGMLIMLARKAHRSGGAERTIRIVNCSEELYQRLVEARLPPAFQLVA